jgi:hypothetical protein
MRLICLVLTLTIWQVGIAQTWRKALEKDGITVWLPTEKNKQGKEFRARTIVYASTDKILKMLRDAEKYPSWVENLSEAKTIKLYNPNLFVIWYKVDMPVGFSDRDVVLENKVVRTQNGTIKVLLRSKPNDYPKINQVVRINNTYGYWLLKPLSKQKTLVIYQFYADAGIELPGWLVNMFLVKGPYKTLKNLRQWVEK